MVYGAVDDCPLALSARLGSRLGIGGWPRGYDTSWHLSIFLCSSWTEGWICWTDSTTTWLGLHGMILPRQGGWLHGIYYLHPPLLLLLVRRHISWPYNRLACLSYSPFLLLLLLRGNARCSIPSIPRILTSCISPLYPTHQIAQPQSIQISQAAEISPGIDPR